jgi:lactoylglutathione lyase
MKMNLGAFSSSLAVKDIAASRAFYEKLGFEPVMGDQAQGWLILRNGDTTIGLFQGMFERNMLTFNPGWTSKNEAIEEFADVREIQQHLKGEGLALMTEADESTVGPGSIMLTDPDGNPILIDQHVDSPQGLQHRLAAKK